MRGANEMPWGNRWKARRRRRRLRFASQFLRALTTSVLADTANVGRENRRITPEAAGNIGGPPSPLRGYGAASFAWLSYSGFTEPKLVQGQQQARLRRFAATARHPPPAFMSGGWWTQTSRVGIQCCAGSEESRRSTWLQLGPPRMRSRRLRLAAGYTQFGGRRP